MGTVNASFRLALTTKSDEELWWLFLTHGEENCANEFWTEVRSRQEAGTLNRASPFWATGIPPINRLTQRVEPKAHFLERISRSGGHERTLSDDALKSMLAYDWPGNVRELENCLERACALTSGPVIHLCDLPSNVNSSGVAFSPGDSSTKIIPMTELERQTILSTITQLNGDKLMAARLLGIGKTTLYRKLKEYASQDS